LTHEATQRKGDETHAPENAAADAQAPRANEVRSVDARELLGARGLLRIEHEGETYTLRLTRNNRLILTK
jgi:hemin uptake protein HemP